MTIILVIDDDPAVQMLLSRSLSQDQGYEVVVAGDGVEGFNRAVELNPALIICDWLMPRLNGLEVCRQIKATPQLSTTFFILLTALDSVADRVKGLDAGADDFVCKPIDLYELNARVRAGLRLHLLSQDLQKQKQLLEAELAEAAEYVASLLPHPIETPFLSIDARFLPSRQLGGDSFDFYWLDEQHIAIYLLDVAGHGLRASLPSVAVINLLRSKAIGKINYYQPHEVLEGLNRTFQMSDRNDKYFTIWYGVYHTNSRQLTYASAGHPPAVLLSYHQHQLHEQRLKTVGFPIGMFEEATYVDAVCQIESPSSLFIFSDGIYEHTQQPHQLEQFVKILHQYYHSSSLGLDVLIEKVKSNFGVFEPFADDLSVIQVNFFV